MFWVGGSSLTPGVNSRWLLQRECEDPSIWSQGQRFFKSNDTCSWQLFGLQALHKDPFEIWVAPTNKNLFLQPASGVSLYFGRAFEKP